MNEAIQNRKALADYNILETFEAGIELRGFEVKSVRNGKMTLAGSYARVAPNGVWLLNSNIAPYQENNTPEDYEPARTRRLLLKQEQIESLHGKMKSDRLTLLPLKVYVKHGLIKVELGLGKGLKKYDKREKIKTRETKREINRRLKNE